MKSNLTDIVLVVDASSSMTKGYDETLMALNAFIKSQQHKEGLCNLTLIKFSSNKYSVVPNWYQNLFTELDVNSIKEVTKEQYTVGGYTALYDAVNKAIDDTGLRLSIKPESERPSKVLFVILTDGEENSSKTTLYDLKNKIARQENVYSWNFVFLGADFNSEVTTSALGLDADARNVNYDKRDAVKALLNVGECVVGYRNAGMSKLSDDFANSVKRGMAK